MPSFFFLFFRLYILSTYLPTYLYLPIFARCIIYKRTTDILEPRARGFPVHCVYVCTYHILLTRCMTTKEFLTIFKCTKVYIYNIHIRFCVLSIKLFFFFSISLFLSFYLYVYSREQSCTPSSPRDPFRRAKARGLPFLSLSFSFRFSYAKASRCSYSLIIRARLREEKEKRSKREAHIREIQIYTCIHIYIFIYIHTSTYIHAVSDIAISESLTKTDYTSKVIMTVATSTFRL